jgi:hypothetical protein
MIRFTWLQSRGPILLALAGLAAVAGVSAVTRPHLAHLYDTTVAHCTAQGDCPAATTALLGADHLLQRLLGELVLVAPVLLGMFWAAPVAARELETGTYRLTWTQSVTRTRWLTVKVAVIGLTTIAVAGLLSFLVTRWFGPIDRAAANRFTPAVFDERGIVVIGYAAFAFSLGLTAGALIRRTLPAIAVTLALFVATRTAVTQWIRPHFQTPLTIAGPKLTGPLGRAGGGITPPHPADWMLAHSTHATCTVGTGAHRYACPGAIRQIIYTVQPASRYRLFQYDETATFLAIAIILAALSYWWIRRRIT